MDIKAEIDSIKHHVDKGNYHAAINLSISAMNACRRIHHQDGVDIFLDLIKDIVQTMTDEFGSQG
ncbi:MAG: hypothetical protein OEY61_09565 [Gammaproteobacteria bacterium]|nr:hypothetical protein [Gammaproteobacteria bacterium]